MVRGRLCEALGGVTIEQDPLLAHPLVQGANRMSARSRPNSLPEQRPLLRTDAHRWNGRVRRRSGDTP